ncbi:MAG: hypothetical protein FJY82_11990 [Candidatus Aminicenantes bacterium]|nr:hypothetical protein [Candidatus Aminicenantes bacterium]
MILRGHVLSMVLYAFFVAVVLAFLRRKDKAARLRYGLFLFLIMAGGAILLGWLMYLFTL